MKRNYRVNRCLAPAIFALLSINTFAQLPHQLLVGDKAPMLPLDKWLKGGPVNIYEKGSVYLIDFWAVWCGPCIASMEHLSALQAKYQSQGFNVIGLTSVDAWGNSYDKVVQFLETKGKAYNYNFAWAPESFRADKKYKSVIYNPWLMAAYDSSSWALPQIFVIDRSGKIAFIGDGYALAEDYLKTVLSNTHNIASEREKYISKMWIENDASRFAKLLEQHKKQDALELGSKVVKNQDAPIHALLVVCDYILNKDLANGNKALLSLGLDAAKRGVKLTDSKAPSQLAVLAKAYSVTDQAELAVATIKQAIDLADGEFKAAMQKDLTSYENLLKTNKN